MVLGIHVSCVKFHFYGESDVAQWAYMLTPMTKCNGIQAIASTGIGIVGGTGILICNFYRLIITKNKVPNSL